MAWFVLIIIFWKPIYYFSKWTYSKIKKNEDIAALDKLKEWFSALGTLIKP